MQITIDISIHSLVKRETIVERLSGSVTEISIHSLVKRETDHTSGHQTSEAISIHSLVKRETLGRAVFRCGIFYFNPLPRKEGDVFAASQIYTMLHFNPLPRKEGDAGSPDCRSRTP